MTSPSCSICLNTFTAKTRSRIACQYCPIEACKECQQGYIVSSHEDPHCYSCKRGWNVEFMAQNFPLSFRNNTLRKHRQTILLEREKAMLPAMQIYAEARKNMERLNDAAIELSRVLSEKRKILSSLRSKHLEVLKQYTPLREKKDLDLLTEEEKPLFKELKQQLKGTVTAANDYHEAEYNPANNAASANTKEYNRWNRIYIHGTDTGQGERVRREFLMKCPATDCRGFLSTAYKCGVCEKSTCADCLEVLNPDVQHTCNPDSVESAKAIKKETRPCPKCAARIFKIDGCDQMWCTVDGCNTAFSWNTGHVVTGRVHNPHYYEWLRRNGGGQAPREIGDIPCGGMPPAWHFTRQIIGTAYTMKNKNRILDIHRRVTDIEARLPNYPARPDLLMNKDINVDYLLQKITETEWQRRLEHTEARFNRKKEIGQILQTLVTAAADTLQGIFQQVQAEARGTDWVITTALPQLESLREYTNDALKTLAKSLHMAVPQIDAQWEWIPIRALYKTPATTVAGAAGAADAADAVLEEAMGAMGEGRQLLR